MKIRKKKNVVIGILCSLLVFMGIGYAILSQVLTINAGGKIKGNWNIYIESITPYSANGEAKSLESEIGIDKLSATIETELNAPKDYVEYKVVVKNNGNINAKLTNAVLVPKKSHEYINFTTTAIKDTEVSPGETTEFIVKVEFKDIDNYEKQDETIDALTELQLNFEQTGKVETSEEEPVKEQPKFTIDSEGTITSYNYDYGTEVIVPSEINGTPVKSINENSFVKSNAYFVTAYNESTDEEKMIVVITDTKNKTAIEQAIYNYACEEMYSGSDSDSVDESTGECGGMTSLSDMGISVYNSTEEATTNLTGYELDFDPAYVNISTGELEDATSRITKLDLSEATNLEIIEEEAFYSYPGYASNGECGNQTEGTCGLGKLESVIFPTNGKLTTIGERAFLGNKLTSVTIPNSITSIEGATFSNNQLTSVTIPSSVISIGYWAFENNQLTNVTIPSSVTNIGDYAFSNNQLTEIAIPNSVTNIGNYAFSNNQITSVTIPSSVTNIEYGTFANNQITSVTIPSSVTTIGDYAFSNNQLTSVTIPSSVITINSGAFTNNLFTSESNIIIDYDNINTIGRLNSQWASIGFPGKGPFDISLCYTVSGSTITAYDETCGINVVIPSSIKGNEITTIGSDAFFRKGLTNVVIPSSITTIGYGAFDGNSLQNITIPSSVTNIESFAFSSNQLSIITIPVSVTSIGNGAFKNNQFTSQEDITIEYNNTNLITRFNSDWNSIGFPGSGPTRAKYGCFYVNPVNPNTIVDYDKNCSKNVNIPSTINGTTITSIERSAFSNKELTSLIIPLSVTTIGAYAFSSNQLTSVTIPEGVTSIEYGAFSNNQLTSVTIPEGVTSIGTGAFQNNQLTSITIPSSLNSISSCAFDKNKLTNITIPSSVTSIGTGAFQNNQLTSVTIPSGVTDIGYGAFLSNKIVSVNNVIIDYNDTNTIGRFNFDWTNIGFPGIGPFDSTRCFNLNGSTIIGLKNYCSVPNNLVIPSVINDVSITSIGQSAFADKGLINVTIPASITTIGSLAFSNNNLTSVTIQGDNLYRFNDKWYAIGFKNVNMPYTNKSDETCYTVVDTAITKYDNTCAKNIVIPSIINGITITSINNYAFSNIGLTNVTIPASITTIGSSAFSNNNLKSVKIQGDDIYRFNDNWYNIGFGDVNMPHTNSSDETCYTISDGKITNYDNKCSSEVIIPSSINGIAITSIGTSAFSNKGLTSVTFENTQENPSQIQEIGTEAFKNNYLTSIIIPSSVTSIGDSAFENNQLASVNIPKNLTTIEYRAFQNNQLTSIIIPPSVTSIGFNAFLNNQLTSIIIPENVTNIGQSAFENNQLASVNIPENVTSIEYMAFKNNQLNSLVFEDTTEKGSQLTRIAEYSFQNNQLTSVVIPYGVTRVGVSAFQNNRLNSLVFEDTTEKVSQLTTIAEYAFANNQLTEVTIPASVTEILYNKNNNTLYSGAFFNNSILNVTVKGDKTRFNSEWYNIGFGLAPKPTSN